MRPHHIYVWTCIILLFGKIYAQTDRFSFETFGTDQGMSNNFCKTIMEDSQGFIWVGTIDGLNRFDGYSFKTFKHNPDDSLSISGNNISAIYEDSYGYIWVGTQKYGLNRYDPRTGIFLHFELDSLDGKVKYHRSIMSIYQDSKHRMWVGSVNGILYLEDYNPENPALTNWKRFLVDKPNAALVGGGYDFLEEENGLWIATTFNIKYYDYAKEKFYLFHFGLPGEAKNNPFIINKIIRRKENELWLATRQIGLMQVEAVIDSGIPKVKPLFIYEPFPLDPNELKLSSGYVLDAEFINDNEIWIGTGFGLDHLNLKEQEIFYYKSKDKGGPSANAIYDMLKDQQGNLWLATELGLNFWGKASKKFFSLSEADGLSAKAMNGFYLENDSILWIASSQGLNRLNRTNGKIKTYLTEKNHDVDGVNSFMTAVYAGPEDHVWVVCRDSIRLVNKQTGRYKTYRPDGEIYRKRGMLRRDFLFSLLDKDGSIWLTGQEKVYHFFPETRKFTVYDDLLKTTSITSMEIDQYGTHWLGTTQGLFVFDVKNEIAFPFSGFAEDSLPFDRMQIKDLHESKDGKLWVGTINGLYYVDMKNSVLGLYHEADGLPNAYIRALEEDETGNIWVSTNQGISKLNPTTRKIITFTKIDGLIGNEFQSRGSWKSPQGEMFFGAMNGFSSFYPEEIRLNSFQPTVHITGFSILNESVPVGAPDTANRNHQYFLPTEINHAKELHLSYKHRVFSLEFSALNYLQTEENQYAFMLEGFDEDWVYTQIRRTTYTNIDPGEYTFKVKGSNNDGVWSEISTELIIVIHPPWWRTWWAYGFYLFLIIAGIWWFFRLRMEALRMEMKTRERIEKAKVEEREKVRARSSRDFHDEAGNKLTKISLYAGLLKTRANSDQEMINFVNGIEANLKELSSGMRDFIWVLDPKHDSLKDTLLRIKEFGDNLFKHAETEFNYINQIPESFNLSLDLNTRRNLLMIFKEGMNNSLKYAKAHEVNMFADLEGELLKIRLVDDGMGFNKNNLSRVNGLNNMKTRAEESGGELIFDASPGLGTVITFTKEIHPNG